MAVQMAWPIVGGLLGYAWLTHPGGPR
jgi:hypothetical protein